MRKAALLVLFILLSLASPLNSFAHIRGVPIAKINGKSTQIYPIQNITTAVFDTPPNADLAPENYLVNQKLEFEIDPNKLPVFKEDLEKTVFIWDFGDGSKPEKIKNGYKNSHIYKRIGTFTMNIYADYSTSGYEDAGKQQVQTTILNILPNKNYHLPKAIIEINGKGLPNDKKLSTDLNYELKFDASKSTAPSSAISSYQWDLGDGNNKNTKSFGYQYTLPQYYATPILRVTDKNGFFTDTYALITNSGKNDPNNPALNKTIKLGILLLAVGILVVIGIFIIIHKKKA
ncbi:MAG TPA: PKD domain-containing protein [Patescibacteria group bacterium]|nr:PKD domain-containing protein [Patescibacteria group bacterium]